MTATSGETNCEDCGPAVEPKGALESFAALLDVYVKRDPASTSRLEVFLCAPGLHAVMWHTMCHGLWRMGLHIVSRMVANIARLLTGVEIHPQAQIGKRLFIDHGHGVVIGATTVIGNDVSIYQGVTLGGVTQSDSGKRHPTVGDCVIIGAGAAVLGPVEIGSCARIGSNAVVVKDVPLGVTAVGVPARNIDPRGTRPSKAKQDEEFVAYAAGDLNGDGRNATAAELQELAERIAELEKAASQQSGKEAEAAQQ